MQNTQMLLRATRRQASPYFPALTGEQARLARAFHSSFPQYAPTPLAELSALAAQMGLKSLLVKDESQRFGLNAFKVLGGSYAIARHIAARLGLRPEEMTFAALRSEAARAALGNAVFFTATDGNHGRGVAWTARELGCRAVVRMPKGTAKSRVENIRALGAEVTVEDCNYDGCVRLAARQAKETPGGVLVQDTAWPGYTQTPLWIMQGYLTMALEADEQMVAPPTHIFLQAGVGSMAAAVAAYFRQAHPQNPPKIILVEPTAADCFFRSAANGEITAVTGEMRTMMAGLACGEPSPIAWDILKRLTAAYLSCEDAAAARGMRALARPLAGDKAIVSGESGASTLGALLDAAVDEKAREALGLDGNARVLLFSTEGDTDPVNYRRVMEEN